MNDLQKELIWISHFTKAANKRAGSAVDLLENPACSSAQSKCVMEAPCMKYVFVEQSCCTNNGKTS